jgi:hypothetical protein
MRNKLRLLVLAGVIAVIIVILVVLKFTVWSTPTYVDFVKTQTAAIAIKTKATALQNSYAAYAKELQTGQSDSTVKETYNKSLAEYKTAVTDMGTLKATKKDDAVHQAYQAFLAKNTKFLNFTQGYVADYPAKAAFDKLGCSSLAFNDQDLLNIAKNYNTFLKQCELPMNHLAKSEDPALAIYGKGMKAYLEKRAGLYQELVDGLNNDDDSKVATALAGLKESPDASLATKIQQAHDDALTTNVIANLITVTTRRVNDTK